MKKKLMEPITDKEARQDLNEAMRELRVTLLGSEREWSDFWSNVATVKDPPRFLLVAMLCLQGGSDITEATGHAIRDSKRKSNDTNH